MKLTLSFSLFFILYACNSVSLSNINWTDNMLELELRLDDGLGLLVLQPKHSTKAGSIKSLVKSLRFLCEKRPSICEKSIFVLTDASLYGKIDQNSCIQGKIEKCSVLMRNWLAIYRPGDKSIITYPYDKSKFKKWNQN